MDRLKLAKLHLAALKRDRTSCGVTPRHLWKLAYWCARNGSAI